jgi:hypothetical protein
MMYNDKTVVAVKVNGRVLREQGDTVTLPFGSEFSILLKNLNSVRAQVKVEVDGKDATDGTRLILAPNSTLELERFIRNGNLNAGNRFKFIERTGAIEDHRGIGAEDGLIRVEAWKEHKEVVEHVTHTTVHHHEYHDDWVWPNPPYSPYYPRPWAPYLRYPRPTLRRYSSSLGAQAKGSMGLPRSASNQTVNTVNAMFTSSNFAPTMDSAAPGITVAGSESRQQFHWTADFPLESQSTVIVLRLVGTMAGAPVSQPVTVETKLNCTTCGRSSKSDQRFCGVCGTALVLV